MRREDFGKLPALKEDTLIAMGNCIVCGKPQLGQAITFYCITIERAIFDSRAIQARAGLEMMLGSGPLARVMGPDADLAKVFDGPHRVFVHEMCAGSVGHLLQLVPKKDEAEKTDAA